MSRCRLITACLLMLTVSACRDAPRDSAWFREEALDRGVDYRYESGADGRYYFPEIMGGGAAVVDVDDDGDLDLYLVQGGAVEGGGRRPGNRLLLNDGSGRFTEAMASGAGDRGYGMGVTAGDYDNDGDADLYVTNWGRNALLRNDGAGRFTDVTEAAGVGDPGWSTAAAFTDLDADGDLDLFVVNYLRWSIATAKSCYALNVRTYCGPLADDAAPDRLYRNDGDGTFTDVTATAGLAASHGSGLGIVSADFDGDGRFDVFVANDGMPNRLWVNKGDLRFDDEALLRGCAMDDHGLAKAGMGVAAGDVDDDGDQDLLVVNLVDQSDSFYRNLGTHFADHSSRVGLAVATRRYTRFGVVLADFDNDGDLDLYQANGRVKHDPEHAAPDVFAEPNVLFEYDAGFMPVPGPVSSPEPLVHTSRATTAGDLDNDGGMDLVVINRDARAYVLMNRASRGANWVRFRVLDASGRDAHGAVVSARVGGQRRWRSVQPAASYLSSNDPRVHFGLGSEPGVSGVQVRWPTGETGAYGDFDAGSTHVLRFGSAHGQ
jgi:hypothetical protein